MHEMFCMILMFSFCPGHWAFIQYVSVFVRVTFTVCVCVCGCVCVFTGLQRFIAVSMQDLKASVDQVTKHE